MIGLDSPLLRVALTLVIGAIGGAICTYAGLPAAWLAGSMLAVTAAVLSGYRVAIYDPARIAVFIILGIQIGGSLSRETIRRMGDWPSSLAILALTMLAVTWSGYVLFRRIYGWSRPTALFSSVPGALSLTLLLADDARAEMPKVTIVQCIRLFFLVAMLPALIGAIGMDGGHSPQIAAKPGSVQDALVLVAAGSAGGLLAERLKLPAGLIIGALSASAAVKLAGFVSTPLPDLLLLPAYVVLGTMIGSRFQSFDRRLIARVFLAGVGGFIVAMMAAFAGALAAHIASDVPLGLTLVAFAPGGLEAMTIMAFALDLDPAYVGAMQIARYVGISLLLPIAAKWLQRFWKG